MNFDRDDFFYNYMQQFGAVRKPDILDNIDTMLSSLESYQNLFNPTFKIEQMSYVCATSAHETGFNFGTWKEVRQIKTDTPRRKEVKRLQDRYWPSGYYGRGPIQLTWEFNYKWAQDLTGRPLLKDPDLLLTDLRLGYEVMIKGMIKGLLTGRSLDHYINAQGIDYENARKIVNGMDRAKDIAGYAKKFQIILTNCVKEEIKEQ